MEYYLSLTFVKGTPAATTRFEGTEISILGSATERKVVFAGPAITKFPGINGVPAGQKTIVTGKEAVAIFEGIAGSYKNVVNSPVSVTRFEGISATKIFVSLGVNPAETSFPGIAAVGTSAGKIVVPAETAVTSFCGISGSPFYYDIGEGIVITTVSPPAAEISAYGLVYYDFYIPASTPAAILYTCILTGKNDSLPDIELPISSFQARLRKEGENYCGVEVPNVDKWFPEIQARKNGQLVIKKGIKFNTGNINYKELVRIDFEEVGYSKGTGKNSISLSGHIEESEQVQKRIYLEKIQIYSLQKNGKRRLRTGVNFFIRPGDLAVWFDSGENEMEVAFITITVNTKIAYMDITET